MSLNNGKIQTSEIKRYQSEDVSIEGTNGDIVGKKTRLNGKQGRLKKHEQKRECLAFLDLICIYSDTMRIVLSYFVFLSCDNFLVRYSSFINN